MPRKNDVQEGRAGVGSGRADVFKEVKLNCILKDKQKPKKEGKDTSFKMRA